MPCAFPKKAWQAAPGVKPVFVEPAMPWKFECFDLPCGKCIECRLERARQWSVRCMHEASLHDENCFLTLTYSPEKLPLNGSLDHSVFQRFMKRFRKMFPNDKFKYYMCGEYGEHLKNPHFHAIIFGFDFSDKKFHGYSKTGEKLYVSKTLDRLWTDPVDKVSYGFAWIGSVTFESCNYVARYVTKKITGDMAIDHYLVVIGDTGEIVQLTPEYNVMSRGGRVKGGRGIGGEWWDLYKRDCEKDFITMRGRKMRPPKYYDALLNKTDEEAYNELKLNRKQAAIDNPVDIDRRNARHEITLKRNKQFKRGVL